MKHDKKVLVLSILTAAAMTVTSPLRVMAENPEFAHDEATWARLRDNVMEYDELQMLVEEYNPTYMNNQVSYKDSRTKDDAETVRQDLKDAADDMTSQAEDMRDTADSLLDLANSLQNMSKEQADAVLKQAGINSVNSLMSSYNAMYLGAAMMDNSAMKQNISADSQYDDDESRKLKYQKTQNGLIMSVQTMFASYNQMKSSLDVIQKNIEIMEAVQRSTETRASLGMATQMDILTAKKNVQSIQSTYTQTRTSLDSVKHSLCLATGWQFNADPDIREVPGADMNRIAAMNPDVDKQTALQNNYDLNYNKKILKNMTEGSTDKKNMERTIKNLEETVAASMVNLYNDILQKKTAFELAEAALATETTAMNAMERKYQLGMASQLDYLQEQAAFLGKQIDRQTAEISLFQAMETYDWALKGMLSTGN